MSKLTLILLVTNQLALALLFWRHWLLRRQAQATAKLLSELPLSRLKAPDIDELLGQGTREVIAIEILNPMELAAKESWFADKFGSLTPALIRKIVISRTLDMLGPQLESYGVKANVSLHRAA